MAIDKTERNLRNMALHLPVTPFNDLLPNLKRHE
jgi:hypothetical protein